MGSARGPVTRDPPEDPPEDPRPDTDPPAPGPVILEKAYNLENPPALPGSLFLFSPKWWDSFSSMVV